MSSGARTVGVAVLVLVSGCSRTVVISAHDVPWLGSTPEPRGEIPVRTSEGNLVTLDHDQLRYVKITSRYETQEEELALRPPFQAWQRGDQLYYRKAGSTKDDFVPMAHIEEVRVVQNDFTRLPIVLGITALAMLPGIALMAPDFGCNALTNDCDRLLAGLALAGVGLGVGLGLSVSFTRDLPDYE